MHFISESYFVNARVNVVFLAFEQLFLLPQHFIDAHISVWNPMTNTNRIRECNFERRKINRAHDSRDPLF